MVENAPNLEGSSLQSSLAHVAIQHCETFSTITCDKSQLERGVESDDEDVFRGVEEETKEDEKKEEEDVQATEIKPEIAEEVNEEEKVEEDDVQAPEVKHEAHEETNEEEKKEEEEDLKPMKEFGELHPMKRFSSFMSADWFLSRNRPNLFDPSNEEEKIDFEEPRSFQSARPATKADVDEEEDLLKPFATLLKSIMEQKSDENDEHSDDVEGEETAGYEVLEGWSTRRSNHVHVVGVGDIVTLKEGTKRRNYHDSGGLIRLFGRNKHYNRSSTSGKDDDDDMTYMVAPCLGKSNRDDVSGYEVLRMAIQGRKLQEI